MVSDFCLAEVAGDIAPSWEIQILSFGGGLNDLFELSDIFVKKLVF